jgi:hypothetical protein
LKSLIRFFCVLVTLSGWAVAALSVHVVRTPDPSNPNQSKLVVVPKNRLNLNDTYVDAREWTMSDVPTHGLLVLRVIQTGKADEFKYLADPKSKLDVEQQLYDALTGSKAPTTTPSRTAAHKAGFWN